MVVNLSLHSINRVRPGRAVQRTWRGGLVRVELASTADNAGKLTHEGGRIGVRFGGILPEETGRFLWSF